MKDIWRIFKIVFSEKKYFFITLSVAFLFYLLNVLITNFRNVINLYSSFGFFDGTSFFVKIFFGFWKSVEGHSFLSLVVISIFLGILVSLIFYKVNLKIKGNRGLGFFGTFGIVLGALIPGCAACGIGLVSLLGLGGIVTTFLPYKGLELSFLAIALLGYAIYKSSKDLINCEECKIKLKR